MKLFFLGFILFTSLIGNAQKYSYTMEELCHEYSKEWLSNKGNKGLVIGVIDGDTTYTFGYGVTDDMTSQTPNEYTFFQIGSVTKVFTGLAIQQLIELQKINLEQKINDVLPTSHHLPQGNEITIRQLLTHYSGLPKLPSNFNEHKINEYNPYKYYMPIHWQQYLHNAITTIPIGSGFQYSNVNYALLGDIIANVSGMSYDQYIMHNILQVCDMKHSGLDIGSVNSSEIATPHRFNGSATEILEFASMESSGAMYSCMHDLLLFMRQNMETTTRLYSSLLQCMQALASTDLKRVKYGMGWQLYYQSKRGPVVVTHSGSTEGHRVYIGFTKGKKKGVVVLSNSANAPDYIGIELLQIINRVK